MTVLEDRLAALEDLKLDHGSHPDFETGHCAMEVVAWLAGEGHTDAPVCASPYLQRFTIRLNDRWDHEQRQLLIPFLPRMVGTGDDGKDPIRRVIARRALCTDLLPPWLRLAGLDDWAEKVEAAVDLPDAELRALLWKARDAGWAKRKANMDALRATVKKRLTEQPPSVAVAAADAAADAAAVAVAVAAADAAAAAVAAAVADAAAAAVAVAAADAAAVAVAVAAADAAAAAVAVAAAAAAAAADADADAVAVAVAVAAAGSSWDAQYNAAYAAARQYYRDHPLSLGQEFVNLAETQRGAALDLLERLIVADVPA